MATFEFVYSNNSKLNKTIDYGCKYMDPFIESKLITFKRAVSVLLCVMILITIETADFELKRVVLLCTQMNKYLG